MIEHLPTTEQRVAARNRPAQMPVMHQSWNKLLFMHWKIPVEILRRLIPKPLEVDTFEDEAWVALTPFTIYDLRPPLLPALPYISSLHELNVRTYVYFDGMPGVWFFSLDANNFLAVFGGRSVFSLPYHEADISLQQNKNDVIYRSTRSSGQGKFAADWTIGEDRPAAEPGSLEFFLTERYCLYTAAGGRIYRCRIHHEPWPLQRTDRLSKYESNMFEINGLPQPLGQPLLHCGGPVHVDVWYPERVLR